MTPPIPSNLPITTNRVLGPLTTIGVGGTARFFCEITGMKQLKTALAWTQSAELPYFVLGGGSNVVFADHGFPGLVLHLALKGIQAEPTGDEVHVHAEAGEKWDDLAALSVGRNWAGIECLSGIPGQVGAAPIQNIGAYGQELSDSLESVQVLDTKNFGELSLGRDECGFGYRQSIFKHRERGRYIVTSLRLVLKKDGRPTLRYPDLQQRLSSTASLQRVRATVLEVRRQKSMVIDPHDPNSRGCGSFFLNPVLDIGRYRYFCKKFGDDHPHFPIGKGRVKLSAAWLIERAGFGKGLVRGNVGLSEKHCLAIVNHGKGTAEEVLNLVAEIQNGVMEQWGIRLTPEPVLFPSEKHPGLVS